jgi:hypothetical protein
LQRQGPEPCQDEEQCWSNYGEKNWKVVLDYYEATIGSKLEKPNTAIRQYVTERMSQKKDERGSQEEAQGIPHFRDMALFSDERCGDDDQTVESVTQPLSSATNRNGAPKV